ncbi:single-stranded DNA-binding protein [Limosilactobacillus gastricus]|uniref:Single-stranded DNA-binding protein n=1 Tax=Limosilactobacillus gastricus DSM 16045 TaxID=1423749 RepID=A0A0R1VF54_9LACO|nr:single-stranded DNA-binding protein [Limosilactobacillus gastricus]KRM02763.1 Single-stranded DNA-binding protein [Limosilactobacillus gastricus DSM 16045]QGF39646.1 single-stranded DNA-binding protein [Limosilactobacillus gastricus]
MLNRAVLTGRLTRDPELRYTNSGTAVARFSIAVDRQFRNQQTGEREADFINCVIWRKSAENFVNFTHKGALVGIDGRITTSNYQNQQGQRVYRTEVTVENFALLEPRSARDNQAGNNQYNNGGYYNNGANNGFNANQGQAAFGGPANNFGATPQDNGNANDNPFGGQGLFGENTTPIDTDSLPFANSSNEGSASDAIDINDQTALKNDQANDKDDDQNSLSDVPF